LSFADWVNNGWLVAHKSSRQEIGNLLGIVTRDLNDSQAKDVSDDWRFAIAYNKALQGATAALAAAGYRASRESHHYRIIQSLELTVGKDAKFIRAFESLCVASFSKPRPPAFSSLVFVRVLRFRGLFIPWCRLPCSTAQLRRIFTPHLPSIEFA